MRYLFLALILAGLLVVGMFGSRGHKFSETPVEVFNDMKYYCDMVNGEVS